MQKDEKKEDVLKRDPERFCTISELDDMAIRFEEELYNLTRRISKDARRDVLNFNLLNHFKKEMWAHRIILSCIGGFAFGAIIVLLSKII